MIIKVNKKIFATVVAVILVTAIYFASVNVSYVLSEQRGTELPIIMYHQLTKSESRAGRYILTVEQFEKDLIFLKSRGYKTVTVKQLLDFSNGKTDLPQKSIMITFDDGCETLYSYALPLLEK